MTDRYYYLQPGMFVHLEVYEQSTDRGDWKKCLVYSTTVKCTVQWFSV